MREYSGVTNLESTHLGGHSELRSDPTQASAEDFHEESMMVSLGGDLHGQGREVETGRTRQSTLQLQPILPRVGPIITEAPSRQFGLSADGPRAALFAPTVTTGSTRACQNNTFVKNK